MYHIYYLINPINCLPFYVGYTKNEKTRLSRHIKEVNQLKKHGKCESNNLMKVGTIRKILESGNKPILTVVESVDDFKNILKLEILHIRMHGLRIHNTGILTNMTLGGEGSCGKKKTKDELDRRATTRRQRFDGVWHSEETRKTMSDAKKGFKTGKPAWNSGLTKETNSSIAAMSAKLKGNTPWNKK